MYILLWHMANVYVYGFGQCIYFKFEIDYNVPIRV